MTPESVLDSYWRAWRHTPARLVRLKNHRARLVNAAQLIVALLHEARMRTGKQY